MTYAITPDWRLPPGVRAVMTTRAGGVSAGPFATFNLATHVGDDPVAVAANRLRLRQRLGVERIAWLAQVHGCDVVRADEVTSPAAVDDLSVDVPQADASVTCVPACACAVMVADCVPVLLCSQDGGVVGAAHAGWRGLANDVIAAAVQAMAVPVHEIRAWIGPAISQNYYEVGAEVRTAFSDAYERPFRAGRDGHYWLDLAALTHAKLNACGVQDVSHAQTCVYERTDLFYSYRRDGTTGRCAALIWRTGDTAWPQPHVVAQNSTMRP